MPKKCLIVMSGDNNDYYGIYCHNYDNIDTILLHLNNYLNRNDIEHLFNYGTINYIHYEFPWIRFQNERLNKGTSEIEYFFNRDELINCYQYVDDIFVFTDSDKWDINPNFDEKKINIFDNILDIIYHVID